MPSNGSILRDLVSQAARTTCNLGNLNLCLHVYFTIQEMDFQLGGTPQVQLTLIRLDLKYTAMPECPFYMKSGKCQFGLASEFRHPKDICSIQSIIIDLQVNTNDCFLSAWMTSEVFFSLLWVLLLLDLCVHETLLLCNILPPFMNDVY
jgi:hypothetical protein